MASDFYGIEPDPYASSLDDPYGLRVPAIARAEEIAYGPKVVPIRPEEINSIFQAMSAGRRMLGAAVQPVINAGRDYVNSMASVIPFPHGGAQPTPQEPAQQTKTPTGRYAAPVIGRDMNLDQLVNMQRKAESSGNYQAINREKKGNTASGAYQYTDRTWNGYAGYAKAMLAPKHVQDRRFAEDVARRVQKYNGDAFKAIAEHYLPVLANHPDRWNEPYRIKSKSGKVTVVKPVATYLRHVLKGTPYQKQLETYLDGQ